MSTTFPAIEVPARQAETKPQPERPGGFAPWPFFAEDEIEAAAAVLRSGKVNYWTGGEGRAFEQEFAPIAGCRYAIALANGTVALELALRALGIGPGDEVVTTPRTFVASASTIVAAGARPLFAEVDLDSGNITAETIRRVITPRTRAVLVVHLGGWPCEMDEILALARERNLFLIEDCAQAHGALYKGRPAGSFGDIAAFSFCQDKIVTTAGEGGMVTTNREDLWRWMWAYKDHGKSYKAAFETTHAPGFRWLHESFGTNWRLSEVQSAVGRAALRKLPRWLDTRRRHAAYLAERLSVHAALRIPLPPAHVEDAFYRFYAYVRPELLADGWTRDRIAQIVASHGIPCGQGSCGEVYLEKAFPPELRPPGSLPNARRLGQDSLAFLVHPTLEPQHLQKTCDAVDRVMLQAARS
jgi:dTDP-4-amino-4,6-dideoxygalactose transaminase